MGQAKGIGLSLCVNVVFQLGVIMKIRFKQNFKEFRK